MTWRTGDRRGVFGKFLKPKSSPASGSQETDPESADVDPLAERYRRVAERGVFDEAFYLRTNPDVARAGHDALRHYLENGFSDQRDPHPLFRQSWYAQHRGAPGAGRQSWLEDYLFEPDAAGVSPHPLFDPAHYAEQAPGAGLEDKAGDGAPGDGLTLLEHYLDPARRGDRAPNALFDPAWYLDHAERAIDGEYDPLTHYVLEGEAAGLRPSLHFDPAAYAQANPDVAAAGLGALEHYLHTGRAEGRDPRPAPLTPGLRGAGSVQARLRATLAYDPVAPARRVDGARAWREARPSILLCAHSAGERLYGAERSYLDVLAALDRLDYNVVCTLPGDDNPAYLESVRQACFEAVILQAPQWRDDREPIERLVLAYRDLIAAHRVDVVYANTIVHLEPLIAARREGCVNVVHVRELVSMDADLCAQIGRAPADVIAGVFERSDFILANSKATQEAFYRPGQTFWVPNVVDPAAFAPAEPRDAKLRFGLVSSNLPKKGLDGLKSLARALEGEAAPGFELVVVGPPTDAETALRQAVEAGEIKAPLRFVGYADTPQAAMAQIDVLLSLSDFAESFGRTVAEAAAAGKPAIGYHWGALPELIEDGETGFLVGYRDIAAVADRVRRLAADPSQAAAMGARAKERVTQQFSPAVLESRLEAALTTILDAARAPSERLSVSTRSAPAIVVTVYNAADALKDCLDSVFAHTPGEALRLIVVDDASDSPDVAAVLAEVEDDPRVSVVRHDQNQGYTRSVNHGIEVAGARDVVILNSDVVVTPGWLEGMLAPARADARIATVTAMGDNAGAFSFPEADKVNPTPEGLDRDLFARMIVQASAGADPVETPTGSGFCMFIRRAALDAAGGFDETAFPRGYGEENDFCMRLMKAGWRHVITPAAYVRHRRNASFGAEREALLKSAQARLAQIHPEYRDAVEAAFSSETMADLRRRARSAYY